MKYIISETGKGLLTNAKWKRHFRVPLGQNYYGVKCFAGSQYSGWNRNNAKEKIILQTHFTAFEINMVSIASGLHEALESWTWPMCPVSILIGKGQQEPLIVKSCLFSLISLLSVFPRTYFFEGTARTFCACEFQRSSEFVKHQYSPWHVWSKINTSKFYLSIWKQ